MADWITVRPNLDPVLDKINPLVDGITSTLDFLISVLNIAQTILEILKAFLVGYLDPLREIVELIIEEVRNVIQDLRQMGLYLTGDWAPVNPQDKFSNLLGGYQVYERRMVSRLLDVSDPNRPDFTPSSSVLGVFFYTSSGDINNIVLVIQALLRFLGRGDLMARQAPYGTPTAPEMSYGTAAAGIATFRQLGRVAEDTLPDSVTVSWAMPAGIGGIGRAWVPAPKGFLIHVSTIPDGFNVLGLTPKVSESQEIENLPRVVSVAIDPRTNGPVKLYGGIADLATDSATFSDLDNTSSPQAPLLVLQKDQNTPLIFPSLLISDKVPLIAKTFFV